MIPPPYQPPKVSLPTEKELLATRERSYAKRAASYTNDVLTPLADDLAVVLNMGSDLEAIARSRPFYAGLAEAIGALSWLAQSVARLKGVAEVRADEDAAR